MIYLDIMSITLLDNMFFLLENMLIHQKIYITQVYMKTCTFWYIIPKARTCLGSFKSLITTWRDENSIILPLLE